MASAQNPTNTSLTSHCPVLQEVFLQNTVEHPDGKKIKYVANISRDNSNALYNTVLNRRPKLVVEIGMAYGVSTLTILSALRNCDNGGRLISIDPYVGWPTGRLVALNQVRRSGHKAAHEHLHEPSYSGIVRFIHGGSDADFVYVDGNHNFDYAFTDFFLADKLIKKDGIIGFNDCGWRSVFRVINFLKRYRRYDELDVGLPIRFAARNRALALVKRLQGRSASDRYFCKREDWEPDCDILRIPGP